MKEYYDNLKKIFYLGNLSIILFSIFILLNLLLSFFEIFGITIFLLIIQRILLGEQSNLFADYFNSWNLNTIFEFNYLIENIFSFLILIYLIKLFLTLIINFQIYQTAQKRTAKIKEKIFLKLNSLNFKKYLDLKSTYYYTFVTNFCDDFYQIFLLTLKFISESIISIFLLTYLIIIDFKIFISFLTLFLIFYFFYNFLLKKNKKYGKIINDNRQLLITSLKSSYDLFKEIKFNPHFIKIFYEKFLTSNKKIMISSVNSKMISSSPRLLLEFLFILLISLLIFLFKDDQFLFSKLSIFGLISIRLLPILNQITNFFTSFNSTINSVSNLFKEINKHNFKDELIDSANSKTTSLNDLLINFRINDINKSILINEGRWVGVYGKSGSGKTSFIESLIGLRDSNYTDIFLKDIKITNPFQFFILNSYYLPQNAKIFDGSLVENISFSKDKDADYKKIHQLLNIVDLSHFSEFLNKNIGSGGKYMSGGEKQRLLIARALYSNKKIIIFDESFNSLNEKMLKKILNAVKDNFPSLILIMVSHDNSIKSIFNDIIEIN